MLNLQELEQKLDAALAAETPESLRGWLLDQRISEPEDQPTPEAEPQLEEASTLH